MTKIKNKFAFQIYDALKQLESSDNQFSIEVLDAIADQKLLFEPTYDEACEKKDYLVDLHVKKNSDGAAIKDDKGFVYNSGAAKQEFLSKLGNYMLKEKEYELTKIKRKYLPKTIKPVRNISSWVLYCVEK